MLYFLSVITYIISTFRNSLITVVSVEENPLALILHLLLNTAHPDHKQNQQDSRVMGKQNENYAFLKGLFDFRRGEPLCKLT